MQAAEGGRTALYGIECLRFGGRGEFYIPFFSTELEKTIFGNCCMLNALFHSIFYSVQAIEKVKHIFLPTMPQCKRKIATIYHPRPNAHSALDVFTMRTFQHQWAQYIFI
jgi:hypothetical protein